MLQPGGESQVKLKDGHPPDLLSLMPGMPKHKKEKQGVTVTELVSLIVT